MSLKKNILANYASQFYVTLIGIVMVPLYLRYMGAEAFGLIGFFVVLQAWFQLLDAGLTATMTREAARFQGGATDALSLRRLLRVLERVFVVVALLGAAVMIWGADVIAGSWLKAEQLPLEEVRNAVALMAVVVALRWLSGLYRGAIIGIERLVWLGGFNIAIATARFVLVIPFFALAGASPSAFFSYQLAIAVIELTALAVQTYRFLPSPQPNQHPIRQWQLLRGVLKFSLGIAFTSSVWVLVTQTDKLLLSRLLSLADYAHFTLGVLVASGVMIISSPIGGALVPRLTRLSAKGNDADLIRLYRNATQFAGVITVPVALVLAFFPDRVLWAWTGNAEIARGAASVLTLYALGNGILVLAAFPYYLQYAKGDLKLHLIGNAIFLSVFVPGLVWATWEYGMIGAGYVWLIANLIPFIFWLPIVHARFARGLHVQWLLRDIGAVAAAPVAVVYLLRELMVWPTTRFLTAVDLVAVGLVLFALAAVSSSWARHAIQAGWVASFARE